MTVLAGKVSQEPVSKRMETDKGPEQRCLSFQKKLVYMQSNLDISSFVLNYYL